MLFARQGFVFVTKPLAVKHQNSNSRYFFHLKLRVQIYYDIMNDIYELVTSFKLIILSNAVSLSNRILVYVDQRHINYDKTKIYDMIHNILIINVQCVKMNF